MTEPAEALRYIAQQVREAAKIEDSTGAMYQARQHLRGARDEYGAFPGPEFLLLRQILAPGKEDRYVMLHVFVWACNNRETLEIDLPPWPELNAESSKHINSAYVLKRYLPALADLIDREADRMVSKTSTILRADLVTMAEVAKLVHRAKSTMKVYSPKWPKPKIQHRGSCPAKWSYRTLRPTLVEQFPNVDLPKTLPESQK